MNFYLNSSQRRFYHGLFFNFYSSASNKETLLYGLFHRCCAETLLELSSNQKYLGATPGIIQVLHTWNQQILYHVHMHCIISGGGLTSVKKLRKSKETFFIPIRVLRDKFQWKFLAMLDELYQEKSLSFSSSCKALQICPVCGCCYMHNAGRIYGSS